MYVCVSVRGDKEQIIKNRKLFAFRDSPLENCFWPFLPLIGTLDLSGEGHETPPLEPQPKFKDLQMLLLTHFDADTFLAQPLLGGFFWIN